MMVRHPDQRVGIFIDTQNMYHSARNVFSRKVNFKHIVEGAAEGRRLIRAIAYVVSTKSAEEAPFFEALRKSGIELREKELMEYLSGQKKADWDVGLAVDAIRMLDMLDVVVIASGDGDFIPLVEYAQSRGRLVEVVGFRETTSSKLIEAADSYVNLSENRRRYLIGNATPARAHQEPEEETEDVPLTHAIEEDVYDAARDKDKDTEADSRPRRLYF